MITQACVVSCYTKQLELALLEHQHIATVSSRPVIWLGGKLTGSPHILQDTMRYMCTKQVHATSSCHYSQAGALEHASCCMQVIGSWHFDWRYMVRGLTIDKQRGNILKIDRHKYVKIAYHGFQELPREERRAIYSNTNVNLMLNSLPCVVLIWDYR